MPGCAAHCNQSTTSQLIRSRKEVKAAELCRSIALPENERRQGFFERLCRNQLTGLQNSHKISLKEVIQFQSTNTRKARSRPFQEVQPMIRMILLIMFFPIAIIYYGLKLALALVLGVLHLIGLVDIARKL